MLRHDRRAAAARSAWAVGTPAPLPPLNCSLRELAPDGLASPCEQRPSSDHVGRRPVQLAGKSHSVQSQGSEKLHPPAISILPSGISVSSHLRCGFPGHLYPSPLRPLARGLKSSILSSTTMSNLEGEHSINVMKDSSSDAFQRLCSS